MFKIPKPFKGMYFYMLLDALNKPIFFSLIVMAVVAIPFGDSAGFYVGGILAALMLVLNLLYVFATQFLFLRLWKQGSGLVSDLGSKDPERIKNALNTLLEAQKEYEPDEMPEDYTPPTHVNLVLAVLERHALLSARPDRELLFDLLQGSNTEHEALTQVLLHVLEGRSVVLETQRLHDSEALTDWLEHFYDKLGEHWPFEEWQAELEPVTGHGLLRVTDAHGTQEYRFQQRDHHLSPELYKYIRKAIERRSGSVLKSLHGEDWVCAVLLPRPVADELESLKAFG